MFVVTEADAAAIRAIFDEHGELSAAIELRRRFPGIVPSCRRHGAPASPRSRRSYSNCGTLSRGGSVLSLGCIVQHAG
jgi:hypothetical protein